MSATTSGGPAAASAGWRAADPAAVVAEAAAAGIEARWHDRGGRRMCVWSVKPAGDRAHAAPLVILHGVTYSTMSVFDLAVPGRPRDDYSLLLRLGRAGYHVHAPELVGYGLSGDEAADATMADEVADVAALLADVAEGAGRPAYLVGWSWGAQLAARCAGERPDLVAKLVFWGSFWGGGPAGRPPAVLAATRTDGRSRRVNTPEHAAADFATAGTYDEAVRDAFVERALRIDPTSPVIGRTEVGRGVPLHEPALLTMPVLVVHGQHDPMAGPADAREMLARVPHSDTAYVVVPGADHNVQFSHRRTTLVRVVDDFLAPTTGPHRGGRR